MQRKLPGFEGQNVNAFTSSVRIYLGLLYCSCFKKLRKADNFYSLFSDAILHLYKKPCLFVAPPSVDQYHANVELRKLEVFSSEMHCSILH